MCEVGLEVGAASPRPAGAGRDLRPGDARGEGPEPAPAPSPGQASQGHSPPRRWPPPCAPRPPSPSCPPGSPRAGGGNRRLRPDSASRRLEARAGEWGAAGRSGRPGVWASVAPVSRSPRGAPGPGWGRRAESAPRGGREGPRGPSGARGGAGAGRRGKGLSLWAESGASGCSRELSQRPGPGAPWEPEHPGRVSLETGLGRPAAPLAGRLPGVRGWSWSFSNLNSHPSIPDEGKQWHFIQTVPFADLLKS